MGICDFQKLAVTIFKFCMKNKNHKLFSKVAIENLIEVYFM